MKIKFLDWIHHRNNKIKKSSIFSIDIQPFGEFFLTSGQDSSIKIWTEHWQTFDNLFSNPMYLKKKNDSNSLKNNLNLPIFILEPHKGSINVVRWSTNGHLFASGGEDGCLIIYEKIRNPIKKTMWRISEVFKIDRGDIIDLAWCPNSSFVGTISLEGGTFVWDLEKKSIYVKLSGYSSWIKGICWDIFGKFLITQSENQKTLIWRTDTWKLFKILKLKKQQKNRQKINLFSRSHWSICGNYLILCNTTFGKKSFVYIFSRLDRFSNCVRLSGKKFIGKTIRSSSRLYKNKLVKKLFSIFSFGSNNGSLGIWASVRTRALLTIKNMRKSQVLDLSWSTNGYELYICFFNEIVLKIKFQSKEIGRVLEIKKHLIFLNFFSSKYAKKNQSLNVFFKFSSRKFNFLIILKKKMFFFTDNLSKFNNFKILFTKYENNLGIKKKILTIQNYTKKKLRYTCYSKMEIVFENIFFDRFMVSFYKKKAGIKKFSVFEEKNEFNLIFNFFFCPVQSFYFKDFVCFIVSKKKKFLVRIMHKKKNKQQIMFKKIYNLYYQYSCIVFLDCRGEFFILKNQQVKITLFPDFYSFFNDNYLNKIFFFYSGFCRCSGLIGSNLT